jgi:hypothetical protein
MQTPRDIASRLEQAYDKGVEALGNAIYAELDGAKENGDPYRGVALLASMLVDKGVISTRDAAQYVAELRLQNER